MVKRGEEKKDNTQFELVPPSSFNSLYISRIPPKQHLYLLPEEEEALSGANTNMVLMNAHRILISWMSSLIMNTMWRYERGILISMSLRLM